LTPGRAIRTSDAARAGDIASHAKETMDRKRIAIACQGGGSQCAFVAGALQQLFEDGIQDRFHIVGLSGTSGGALTAAVAWRGMLERARGDRTPVGDRIANLWKDLTAQTAQEIVFDTVCVELLRLVEHGYLPTVARSPSSPFFKFWARTAAALIGRPEFTDLRALLLKHIDFGALPPLVGPDSPVLLISAADVQQGNFKVFSSAYAEITADALLASAAIPTLFPAVWVAGHAYWDGIFASNPPVIAFLRKAFAGYFMQPQEIWILQVNRAQHESVPEWPADITDRRNHLAGNLSLQHELEMIQIWNMLIEEGALSDQFRERFGIEVAQPVTVRFIRMSKEIQETLDYPSKLSRDPRHIEAMLADGRAQAAAFLASVDAGLGGEAPAAAGVVESMDMPHSM